MNAYVFTLLNVFSEAVLGLSGTRGNYPNNKHRKSHFTSSVAEFQANVSRFPRNSLLITYMDSKNIKSNIMVQI
ncbi:hypothetical protein L596_002289 [Steinernema carpocapsae]|uniref:Uncharacterized protein n=1 Tax=Steinernema carpocapsae TaxID=34508 RepID=A0A4V6I7N5_STECR|nr:hypothetical protein L596_002289 [Steinernema carpocapsae]